MGNIFAVPNRQFVPAWPNIPLSFRELDRDAQKRENDVEASGGRFGRGHPPFKRPQNGFSACTSLQGLKFDEYLYDTHGIKRQWCTGLSLVCKGLIVYFI